MAKQLKPAGSLSPATGMLGIVAVVSKSEYYLPFPIWDFLGLSIFETTNNGAHQKYSLDPSFKKKTTVLGMSNPSNSSWTFFWLENSCHAKKTSSVCYSKELPKIYRAGSTKYAVTSFRLRGLVEKSSNQRKHEGRFCFPRLCTGEESQSWWAISEMLRGKRQLLLSIDKGRDTLVLQSAEVQLPYAQNFPLFISQT